MTSLPTPRSAASEMPAPRKSTLFLIRQFARTYSCAAPLPATLGGIVAN